MTSEICDSSRSKRDSSSSSVRFSKHITVRELNTVTTTLEETNPSLSIEECASNEIIITERMYKCNYTERQLPIKRLRVLTQAEIERKLFQWEYCILTYYLTKSDRWLFLWIMAISETCIMMQRWFIIIKRSYYKFKLRLF